MCIRDRDNAGSDNSSSKSDLPGDDASTDTGNTGGSSDGTSADNDIPVYTDPSANGFSDGEKDDFNSGKNDMPELSPTPTPALDDHTTYFDPYYRKGDPNITDGDEPFYQKLDADSVPFTGSGTEDDPYVYLCLSLIHICRDIRILYWRVSCTIMRIMMAVDIRPIKQVMTYP